MSYFPIYEKQRDFLLNSSPFRGFVGGRGSGKTHIGAYDLLCRALPGRLYLAGAPTYRAVEDYTLRTFRAVAEQIECPYDFQKSTMSAMLWNGAEILFRSAEDPEKFRGPSLSGGWLDEASLMPLAAYEVLIACLREQQDMGWLSATFTPKGRLHWTYDVFGRGRPDTALVHARTQDNPFLPKEFYDTIRRQYGEGLRADQELGGLFVDIAGAEWPWSYFDWPGFWFDQWPDKLTIRTIALDPSKGKGQDRPAALKPTDDAATRRDYSAFVLLGRSPSGELYCEADMDNVRDISRIIYDGLGIYRRFPADGFGVETNQFQSMMATEFERVSKEAGVMLPIWKTVNTENKEMRIRRLTPYLAQRLIHFRRTQGTELLVEQLRAFPEANHDDGPDALEMALRLMVEMWNNRAQTPLMMRG